MNRTPKTPLRSLGQAALLLAGAVTLALTSRVLRATTAPPATAAAPTDPVQVIAGGGAAREVDAATTTLRTLGPPGLARLLAAYDASPPGAAHGRLQAAIDRVAAQRDAHVSRLYWYTDLERAKQAARARNLPILSLHMLGRLDEELSCANSRFFRTVLYANRDLSRYLGSHFVLHWSSERPVPRVTIDFGDGRKLLRTVAGNSIHYVLDRDGRLVDGLPGLYTPRAFRQTLEAAETIAVRSAGLPQSERVALVSQFHRDRLGALRASWQSELGPEIGADLGLRGRTLLDTMTLTQGKGAYERPMVVQLALGSQLATVPADSGVWAGIGARWYGRDPLDDQSIALIRAKNPSDWAAAPRPVDGGGLGVLLASLRQSLATDTARNELRLHSRLHEWLSSPEILAGDLTTLDNRVYAELFWTPKSDPWLGLGTPGVFSGIAGDGISVAAPY